MRVLLTLFISLSLAGFLFVAIEEFPPFGNPNNPVHNEVSARYIEDAAEETGAANMVTGLILDYRGFDTFFEATVIATSLLSIIPLFIGGDSRNEDSH